MLRLISLLLKIQTEYVCESIEIVFSIWARWRRNDIQLQTALETPTNKQRLRFDVACHLAWVRVVRM